eukprot:14602799-Alexandrium_andersonii.AAC.1
MDERVGARAPSARPRAPEWARACAACGRSGGQGCGVPAPAASGYPPRRGGAAAPRGPAHAASRPGGAREARRGERPATAPRWAEVRWPRVLRARRSRARSKRRQAVGRAYPRLRR